jgi:RHS repeat-associated protein
MNGAAGSGTRFHHPDRLGTNVVTDQSNGELVTKQMGMPYGTQQPSGGFGGDNSWQNPDKNNPSKKRFTSYDRSDATGLDYAVNRFYQSAQGRFTQVDPIGMSAVSLSDPQSLNLYSYCGNDPINHVDPDGLFFKKLFGWIGKAIKAVAKVFAVVLAVAAVLAFSWGFGAIGVAALIGAGVFALIGWGSGKLAQLAAGIAFPSGGYGGFRTPNTFPSGANVGGVSNFVAQQPKREKQLRPQIIIVDTGGDTAFEKRQDEVVRLIDRIRGSEACNKAFKDAGIKTPREIYDGGLILGAKRALSQSVYNDVLGLTNDERIRFFRRTGVAVTITGNKRGKPIILFREEAFTSKEFTLQETVTHEFIHAAGVGLHTTLFGSHDLSGYKHYDSIINACK